MCNVLNDTQAIMPLVRSCRRNISWNVGCILLDITVEQLKVCQVCENHFCHNSSFPLHCSRSILGSWCTFWLRQLWRVFFKTNSNLDPETLRRTFSVYFISFGIVIHDILDMLVLNLFIMYRNRVENVWILLQRCSYMQIITKISTLSAEDFHLPSTNEIHRKHDTQILRSLSWQPIWRHRR